MERPVQLKATLHRKNSSWFLELESNRKSDKAFREFLRDMDSERAEVIVLETNDSTEAHQQTRINFRVKSGPDFERIKSGLKSLISWVTEG